MKDLFVQTTFKNQGFYSKLDCNCYKIYKKQTYVFYGKQYYKVNGCAKGFVLAGKILLMILGFGFPMISKEVQRWINKGFAELKKGYESQAVYLLRSAALPATPKKEEKEPSLSTNMPPNLAKIPGLVPALKLMPLVKTDSSKALHEIKKEPEIIPEDTSRKLDPDKLAKALEMIHCKDESSELHLKNQPFKKGGNAKVYIPHQFDFVIKEAKDDARIKATQEVRDLAKKLQLSDQLVIPKSEMVEDYIVEDKIPFVQKSKDHFKKEQVALYNANPALFDHTALEFFKLHCHCHVGDLVGNSTWGKMACKEPLARFDNAALYVTEEEGQQVGKMALLDIEDVIIYDQPDVLEGIQSALAFFPLHFDKLYAEAVKLDPAIAANKDVLKMTTEAYLEFNALLHTKHIELLSLQASDPQSVPNGISVSQARKAEIVNALLKKIQTLNSSFYASSELLLQLELPSLLDAFLLKINAKLTRSSNPQNFEDLALERARILGKKFFNWAKSSVQEFLDDQGLSDSPDKMALELSKEIFMQMHAKEVVFIPKWTAYESLLLF